MGVARRASLFALSASLVVAVVAVAPAAWAHPFTDETVPPRGAGAPVGTTQVAVFYSEQVELEFSSLKVFDGDGNQVDNRDTAYHVDERSLVVTTPPLGEGAYTVASKVLSRVDGHLVPDAFVFGVGGAEVSEAEAERAGQGGSGLIFYPEAVARFPGLVGQTVVLGAAIAAVFVCGMQQPQWWRRLCGWRSGGDWFQGAEDALRGRFMAVTGAGIVAVIASNILMLAIQTSRLEVPVADVLGATSFGTVWAARMAVTAALLAAWFVLGRTAGGMSARSPVPILAMSLVLISTTTLIGHGAASEQAGAVILDYVHNLVAAAWIGGVIFFAFAVLPALSGLRGEAGERAVLAMIPRFSAVAVACLGVVMVSGPLLMWFLEDDVGVIVQSTYGRLIIAKLAIAAGMVAMGGYHQFVVQRQALSGKRGLALVRKRLGRALRAESVLGVALLGVVALLANGTLPAGEVRADLPQEVPRGITLAEFSGDVRFLVDVYPFARGANTVGVRVTDARGGMIADLDSVRVKVSNPERGISPIEVGMQGIREGGFEGEATFGFSGRWLVEVEARRTGEANEAVSLDLLVKPRLADLRTEVVEYELPGGAKPLYPVYDGMGAVWVSDTAAPVLWRFSIKDGSAEPFAFEGGASQALAMDGDGRIWFTDIPGEGIGYLDPRTGESRVIGLPDIVPHTGRSVPVSLAVDDDGGVWTAVVTKGVILRYDPGEGEFETFELADRQGAPFAVLYDGRGTVWYSESASGRIGMIDTGAGEVVEVLPGGEETGLASPEALALDGVGGLWITEHSGQGIARYDTVLGTLERVAVPSQGSLPFGMAFDRYGNIWFAQHQIDLLGVYDPHNGDMIEVPIPTEGSFVQFVTADGDGNIWMAEPEGGKIGVVRISEGVMPASSPPRPGQASGGEAAGDAAAAPIRYFELAGPLMAAGIVATSLFFARAVGDIRRVDKEPPAAG